MPNPIDREVYCHGVPSLVWSCECPVLAQDYSRPAAGKMPSKLKGSDAMWRQQQARRRQQQREPGPVWSPSLKPSTRRSCWPSSSLFELIGDLVDAGLGARLVLVAARRAGNADGADRLFAGLDRQRAAGRDHVAKPQPTGVGGLGDVLGELARGQTSAA